MKIIIREVTRRMSSWEPIYASIDITTGFLWWRKTTRHWIRQSHIGMRWRFSDTNELVPEDACNQAFETWKRDKHSVAGNRSHP